MTERKLGMSPSKRDMVGWIERVDPILYASKLHQLGITVAEALLVMSDIMEMSYQYQERVVREMVRLEAPTYSPAAYSMEG